MHFQLYREVASVVKKAWGWALEAGASWPGSSTAWLCDCGQVPQPLWASGSSSVNASLLPSQRLLQRSPPIRDVNMSLCKHRHCHPGIQKQTAHGYVTSRDWSRLLAKYAHLMGFYKYTPLPQLIMIFLIISSFHILPLYSLCLSPVISL